MYRIIRIQYIHTHFIGTLGKFSDSVCVHRLVYSVYLIISINMDEKICIAYYAGLCARMCVCVSKQASESHCFLLTLYEFLWIFSSDNSISFLVRFGFVSTEKIIMACMLTLISPTLWFEYTVLVNVRSRSLAYSCLYAPCGDQANAKGASKYVCLVMDFCGRAMISLFLCVSLFQAIFDFSALTRTNARSHTHTQPQNAVQTEIFLLFFVLFDS